MSAKNKRAVLEAAIFSIDLGKGQAITVEVDEKGDFLIRLEAGVSSLRVEMGDDNPIVEMITISRQPDAISISGVSNCSRWWSDKGSPALTYTRKDGYVVARATAANVDELNERKRGPAKIAAELGRMRQPN